LLRAGDGALVETVIIPGPGRTTVCISSQVGCARACSFCETGALGLERQLDAAEIVDQIRVARALWGSKSPPIQNVVFMGMGEPFDNLAEGRARDAHPHRRPRAQALAVQGDRLDRRRGRQARGVLPHLPGRARRQPERPPTTREGARSCR
jgi:hypothetical protein